MLYLIKQRKEAEEKKPPKDREDLYIDELKEGDTIIFEVNEKGRIENFSFSEDLIFVFPVTISTASLRGIVLPINLYLLFILPVLFLSVLILPLLH